MRSWGRRVLGRWYQRHRVLISLCKGAGGTQDEAREVEVGLGVIMTAACEKAVCPQQKKSIDEGKFIICHLGLTSVLPGRAPM